MYQVQEYQEQLVATLPPEISRAIDIVRGVFESPEQLLTAIRDAKVSPDECFALSIQTLVYN